MSRVRFDWPAISADPEFRGMLRRKRRFVLRWLSVVLGGFLLLPIASGFFPDVMAYRLIGNFNVGLLLGLMQFGVAALVATVYVRTASRDFDRVNAEVIHQAFTRYRIR